MCSSEGLGWILSHSISHEVLNISHMTRMINYIICMYQDTWSCVSGQESRVMHKFMWRTSVLFTGNNNSPFSTPCISITTMPISIKFTYFRFSIYATQHTKFERNQPSSLRDMCSWKLPNFFTFFFFFAPFYKSNFQPTKSTLPVDRFLSNLAHL